MKYKYCSICAGRLKKRKDSNLECPKCGFINYRNPRPTASALVLYKDKLLLTKRAHAPFAGWWDLPGGFVDRGEDPAAAIKRELKEETGLSIKVKKLLGVYPGFYPASFDPFHVLSLVYLAQASTSKLQALDDVAESRWFDKKELPHQIAFDSNQKVMREFKKIWK